MSNLEVVRRPTGFATCTLCEYLARLTGDTDLEVGSTLRRILLAHLIDAHPEHPANLRPLDTVVMLRPKEAAVG